MSPAAAPLHGALHLLDLPEDVLAAMAARLPFSQRLCLSLVCRKLRHTSDEP